MFTNGDPRKKKKRKKLNVTGDPLSNSWLGNKEKEK
jgi:hypothetical protein